MKFIWISFDSLSNYEINTYLCIHSWHAFVFVWVYKDPAPTAHLNIHNFEELPTLKIFFLLTAHTDKNLQHSSINWPVWLNGWVFIFKLIGCGFESRCSHLIFSYWFLLVNTIIQHKKQRQKKTLRRNLIITGALTRALKHSLVIPVTFMDLLKVPRFPYLKRLHNKGHLNFVTELMKDFSPSFSNKLYVTHSESCNNGNLEPKSELIIFFFFWSSSDTVWKLSK